MSQIPQHRSQNRPTNDVVQKDHKKENTMMEQAKYAKQIQRSKQYAQNFDSMLSQKKVKIKFTVMEQLDDGQIEDQSDIK